MCILVNSEHPPCIQFYDENFLHTSDCPKVSWYHTDVGSYRTLAADIRLPKDGTFFVRALAIFYQWY